MAGSTGQGRRVIHTNGPLYYLLCGSARIAMASTQGMVCRVVGTYTAENGTKQREKIQRRVVRRKHGTRRQQKTPLQGQGTPGLDRRLALRARRNNYEQLTHAPLQ